MPEGSREIKYFMTAHGETLTSHLTVLERLTERLHLREVYSLDESNVVISFAAVVSRAGTDIEAALQAMPETTKPVVLVVLHHTFDPYFITAESRQSVNRENVFTVDCLFHEDRGLLRCERNDEALKAVTDHLKAIRGSSSSEPLINNPAEDHSCFSRNTLVYLGGGLALVAVIVMVSVAIYLLTRSN